MEPLTMIVSALAAGAAAALKPTAEQVIKDVYAGVKALIQRKYAKVDLTPIERRPESEAKRKSVQEDLTEVGADKDPELLKQVTMLIEVLEKNPPAATAAAAIGIDLKEVKAASLRIKKVISDGTAIRVEKSEFGGDIDIGEVLAGKGKSSGNP
jgi:hypothetical protein